MQNNGMSSIKYVWVILAPSYVVWVILAPSYVVWDATEKQFA